MRMVTGRMNTFLDLLSSVSFVLGWFIVIVAACYFIPSVMLGGFFLMISSGAIILGVLLIWTSKQL
ncbi:hypothetical protein EQV77_05010 [Halobacillus fulvus]|nr:hypothetical protein EQV77_05010 [Halobacillus fulvus]